MTNQSPASNCILCPDRDRIPYRQPVCESCRHWLASMISDIRAYAVELAAPADLVPDERTLPVPFGPRLRGWHDLDNNLTVRRRDYINALLPSGSNGTRAGGGPVSGSRNPPIPINVDAVDIMMPARQGSVAATVTPMTYVETVTVKHYYVRVVDGEPEYVVEDVTGRIRRFAADAAGNAMYVDTLDQIGYLPLAAVLDSWVRDWRETRNRGEGLPDASVDDLCLWLHNRVEWACDEHPAIATFAEELRSYRSAMAGILGLIDVPDYKVGVACPKCDARSLYQRYGGPRDGLLWIECAECPAILSPDEYAENVVSRAAMISVAA